MSSAISHAFSVFFEAFGYYTEDSVEDAEQVYEDDLDVLTKINIAGYFPLVGMGAAIRRWKFTYEDYHSRNNHVPHKAYIIGQIVRGILEFIGLGIVAGLIDIPVSINRHSENLFPCCYDDSSESDSNEGF